MSAEILKGYSRYSYDLPALARAALATREAPKRPRRAPKARSQRNLRVALGPDVLAQIVADRARGDSQVTVAKRYGIAQSSVSKYVALASGPRARDLTS